MDDDSFDRAIVALHHAAAARALNLDGNARGPIIGTEGAAEPAPCHALVGRGLEAIMARQGGA